MANLLQYLESQAPPLWPNGESLVFGETHSKGDCDEWVYGKYTNTPFEVYHHVNLSFLLLLFYVYHKLFFPLFAKLLVP